MRHSAQMTMSIINTQHNKALPNAECPIFIGILRVVLLNVIMQSGVAPKRITRNLFLIEICKMILKCHVLNIDMDNIWTKHRYTKTFLNAAYEFARKISI
jgi:hypothetical protein